jgi:hypothetical protein
MEKNMKGNRLRGHWTTADGAGQLAKLFVSFIA